MDKGVFDYLKGKKPVALVALLIFLGLLLVLLPFGSGDDESETYPETLSEYKEKLEDEVASLASSVKGVGKCRVLITFERGAQNTYRGSELIESKPPLVLGVTVVCAGGENAYVRAELVEMLTALFDIPSTRVAVLKYD